jgi:hypothetical protein
MQQCGTADLLASVEASGGILIAVIAILVRSEYTHFDCSSGSGGADARNQQRR